MTQFLLAVLVAGSTQLQTLGPFNDVMVCENIATQLKQAQMIKSHKCVTLPPQQTTPAPAAKQ